MSTEEREERSPAYIIPRNYEDSFITSGGISFRSIIEGAVMAAVIVPIFIFLPIQLLYRAILIAVFGGILFGFGMLGIKHCYVSEFIIKFFKFKRSSHTMVKNDEGMFDELNKLIASTTTEEENSEDTQNEQNGSKNTVQDLAKQSSKDKKRAKKEAKKLKKEAKKKSKGNNDEQE